MCTVTDFGRTIIKGGWQVRQVTDLKEIQGLALNLLIQLDKFCKEFHIEYYLAYGTLLGAVRHQGFIPWDDDIDIWMKREDYRILIKEFPEWGKTHNLYLNVAQTIPKKYNRIYAQVCLGNTKLIANDRRNDFEEGYFLDIFPIDGTPNNSFYRWFRLTYLQILKNIATLSAYGKNRKNASSLEATIIKIMVNLIKIFDIQKLMLRYEKVASQSSCSSSGYLQVIRAGRKGRNDLLKKELFDTVVQVPFESIIANVPSEFDKILRHFYGDYMSLPPVEERKPHHDYILFIEDC